jgi:futalosine hydrolase
MNILLVSATEVELSPIIQILETKGNKLNFFSYGFAGHTVTPLITGVGMMRMAFSLGRYQVSDKIDLAILCGIGGAYDLSIALGSVVEISSETIADLGAEDKDGSFLDLVDLGLQKENDYPFKNNKLLPHKSEKYSSTLSKVDSLTVNLCSGTSSTIELRTQKYGPTIENMEGAAFFYACTSMDIPCIQFRAISNYVTPRDRSSWQFSKALEAMGRFMEQYLITCTT